MSSDNQPIKFDPALNSWVWEESCGYDPDSEWCRAIDERIRAADFVFLVACGVVPDLDWNR